MIDGVDPGRGVHYLHREDLRTPFGIVERVGDIEVDALAVPRDLDVPENFHRPISMPRA